MKRLIGCLVVLAVLNGWIILNSTAAEQGPGPGPTNPVPKPGDPVPKPSEPFPPQPKPPAPPK